MNIGNKTQADLSESEVNALADARVAALVQAAMLEANTGKAIRVDTGAAEVPKTGVVYYAPPPYNFFAGAKMQRFTGTGAGANITLIASGVASPITHWGFLTNGASGGKVQAGYPYSATNASGLSVTSGALLLDRGTNMDDADDSYDIMAVYVPA